MAATPCPATLPVRTVHNTPGSRHLCDIDGCRSPHSRARGVAASTSISPRQRHRLHRVPTTLNEHQLIDRYQTVCDPASHARQSLDLAFHVADRCARAYGLSGDREPPVATAPARCIRSSSPCTMALDNSASPFATPARFTRRGQSHRHLRRPGRPTDSHRSQADHRWASSFRERAVATGLAHAPGCTLRLCGASGGYHSTVTSRSSHRTPRIYSNTGIEMRPPPSSRRG